MLDGITKWLEQHMMPCFYKQYLGMDCPGCGFQRSFVALLRGDFTESLMLYPPLIPLLLMLLFLLVHLKFKFRNGAKWLLGLFFFNTFLILGNFILRIVLSNT